MDNLVNEILKFKEEIEKFEGDFKLNESLFSPNDIDFIKSGKTDYEKGVNFVSSSLTIGLSFKIIVPFLERVVKV